MKLINVTKVFLIRAAIRNCSPFFILLLVSACTTVAPLTAAKVQVAESVMLGVPFYEQAAYHCGPAALAGLFQYRGKDFSPESIADWVYVPDRQGSFQIEMLAAIRRAHLLAYQLDGKVETLLAEVNSGSPILVLQNLGLSWLPKWHYANLVGFDLPENEFILHSGSRANYRVAASTFIRTWKRAGSWAVVATPADNIPETANEVAFIKAAVDLETLGYLEEAESAYSAALNKWPRSSLAMMGLGNISYASSQYDRSVELFSKLVEHDPDNALAWNNLAYAYLAIDCPSQAKQSVATALQLSPGDTRIKDSYSEIYAEQESLSAANCRYANDVPN